METQSINDGLSLSKAESFTYMPDGSLLEKNVKYFESGAIVADTTFNESGEMISRIEHVKNGNIYTQTVYTVNGGAETVTDTYIFAYDNQGRLIERERISEFENDVTTITYGNGTITTSWVDNNTGEELETSEYTVNAEGIITSATYNYMDLSYTSTLEFENGKPVECTLYYPTETGLETDVYTFSYYSNPMPANHIKSAIQINNQTLQSGSSGYFSFNGGGALSIVPYFCNYYLQSLQNNDGYHENHVKEFNTEGYLISDRRDLSELQVDTFYYYE